MACVIKFFNLQPEWPKSLVELTTYEHEAFERYIQPVTSYLKLIRDLRKNQSKAAAWIKKFEIMIALKVGLQTFFVNKFLCNTFFKFIFLSTWVMSAHPDYTVAAILTLGGAYGYYKAKSVPSLVGSLVFASGFLFAA